MSLKPIHFRWEWDLQSEPEAFWAFVADTDRLNQDSGLPAVQNRLPRGSRLDNARRRLRMTIYGVPLDYEEQPFEWVRPLRYGVARRYQPHLLNPVAEFRMLAELEPRAGGGTHLTYQVWATPANVLGVLAIPVQIGFINYRRIDRAIRRYDRAAASRGTRLSLPSFVSLAPGAPERLQAARDQLTRQGLAAAQVDRLIDTLERADDQVVTRLRPYALADAWGEPRAAILELCLRATRAGLLDFQWDVLCPNCRGARLQVDTLGEVNGRTQVHCDTCNIDYTANLERSVELTFRPNPAIRPVTLAEFCVAGPQVTPHIAVQQLLRPGERRTVTAALEPGRYRLRALDLPGSQFLTVADGARPEAVFQVSPAGWPADEPTLALRPRLHLENAADREHLVILERTAWSDQATLAADVTALQIFRDLFANEALRPGEQMVRYYHHRGRWVVFPNYPDAFKRYPNETGPEGPTERFWPRRQWGNGYFHYAPRLSNDSRDVELGADQVHGLQLREDGLVCEGPSGHAIFAFESLYIYCGIPDPLRRVPSTNGAILSARFHLPPGTGGRAEAAVEHSDEWQTIWSSDGQTGEVKCKADFTALAEAQYRLRLRFVLEGAGATLEQFQTRLWFMVSPHSLPPLRKKGANRMSLHSGDAYGLHTRTRMIEHQFNTAESVSTAFATENLRHAPQSYARLLPIDASRPWQVIYELLAPDAGKMAWASIYAIIEGRRPEEPYDGHTARIDIADSPNGPWQLLAEKPILEHPRGWHFGLFGQGRFCGTRARAYVRLSARKGALGLRIAAHYVPAGEPNGPGPIAIEHAWYEDDPQVGRRLRTHVEHTDQLQHEYTVQCANDPHDERITLSVPSATLPRLAEPPSQ
mgnify:CR=1 FL=1